MTKYRYLKPSQCMTLALWAWSRWDFPLEKPFKYSKYERGWRLFGIQKQEVYYKGW